MVKLLPVLLILVLALGGGYYFYSQQNKGNTDTKSEATKTVNKSPKIGIISDKKNKGYEESITTLKMELTKKGYTPSYLQEEVANNNWQEIADKYADQKVDVIVANTSAAAKAAIGATTTIPVVFGGVANPVADGVVDSLDAPSGNATGVSSLLGDISVKRLEFLKELVPSLKKIYWLNVPGDKASDNTTVTARKQAQMMGITLVEKGASSAAQVDTVINSLKAGEADGIAAVGPLFQAAAGKLAAAQNRTKIPVAGFDQAWVDQGTVFAYGLNYSVTGKQVADIIDQVLNGKKIKEIPVQRPEKVDLIVNKKAAAGIGLTIPELFLKKADKVVE